MKHFVGLEVSLKETSICIVDETGRICREMKAPSDPKDLVAALSQWLFDGPMEAGLPAVCIETRHAKAFLKAQVNKSDRK